MGLGTDNARGVCGVNSDEAGILSPAPNASTGPRMWHIEQALDASLDLQAWQIAQVERSMAEMDAGKGVPHEAIEKELRNWGARKWPEE